jgi:hypothetical protein
VTAPTPLLDFFRRGEVARDVRLLAAQGAIAPRVLEQLAILIVLLEDHDPEIRSTANETLTRLPEAPLKTFLARADVPASMREFFAKRGITPAASSDPESEDPLIDVQEEIKEEVPEGASEEERRLSINQQLAKMGFSDRLKAACKGSREMRAILIRDPNKLICTTVLSSPKLTEQEVESFSRMANVAEDVLRIIGSNRAWMKNYGVVVGLTKNPKTPLGMSLNLMGRLNDRDLQMLSMDRNVPEPLRVAARKRVVAATSKK